MTEWFMAAAGLGALSAFFGWTATYSVREDVDIDRSPGLRVPTTLASRRAWLAAHRRARAYFLGAGVLSSVAAVAFVVWAALADPVGSATAPTFAVLGVLCVVLAAGAVLGLRAERRVAREPRTGA